MREISKSGWMYHMAIFYNLFEMYDGEEDVKRVSKIFFPNNFVSLFKSFEVMM